MTGRFTVTVLMATGVAELLLFAESSAEVCGADKLLNLSALVRMLLLVRPSRLSKEIACSNAFFSFWLKPTRAVARLSTVGGKGGNRNVYNFEKNLRKILENFQ